VADVDLRALLSTLDPKARDDLRRVLIRDHADRDAIASRLNALPLHRRRRIKRSSSTTTRRTAMMMIGIPTETASTTHPPSLAGDRARGRRSA
jgi:hypothetical protein